MSSKSRKWSGNHGGSQQVATPTAVAAETRRGLTPQESKASFVVPHVSPIKKSPSIKDVLAEPEPQPVKAAEEKQPTVVESVVNEQTLPQPKEIESVAMSNLLKPIVDEEEELAKGDEILDIGEDEELEGDSSVENRPSQEKEFTSHWNQMLDVVFGSIPSVRSPLMNMPPQIIDNVMHIVVPSSIQQKNIEQKKREVLNYFQTHLGSKISDFIVEISELAETKKVIYDNHDKYEYLLNENAELRDFMETLNAKISI